MSDEQQPVRRELTVKEAGALGGEVRKKALGSEGYSRLGKAGGKATKERHASEHYSKIGAQGGQKMVETRGKEFFQEIGKKGGQRVRELIERGKRPAAGEPGAE
jgi:general stress protein YciG